MKREVMRFCDNCKNWVWLEKKLHLCPNCTKLVDRPRMGAGEGIQIIHDMKPYVSENMGHEPVYIDGRAQFREELKRRHLECKG